VLVADYWWVRRTELSLEDLYLAKGAYRYTAGWNFKAVAATALGCLLAWSHFIVKELTGEEVGFLRSLFDYAWFVGFGASALLYMALMPRLPLAPAAAAAPNPAAPP
jgi:NCS1 family nucleobase:cation symporter-1